LLSATLTFVSNLTSAPPAARLARSDRPASAAHAPPWAAAAVCTALRCVESVLARPALLPLRAHEVIRAVHAPALLFDPLGAAQPGGVHILMLIVPEFEA